nr:BadF/BadG/BcrA/BcrD ATPase family protein [Brooklawnia cerclae]
MADAIHPALDLPGLITDQPVVPQLAERVRAAREHGLRAQAVAIGSSALPADGGADELLGLLTPDGITRLWLAHDSVTNYLATVGDRPGVAVAAGTGVVTLASGPGGVARVDGWGYLIGDAGSGYWIGRAGLDAVMRAEDGRGPATALTPLVRGDFDSLPGAYLELQADDAKVARIASYAKVITDLADRDDVCHRICASAAAELAHSALTGATRVGLTSAPDAVVGMSGNIFRSKVIADEFVRLVSAGLPTARFTRRDAGSLTGVARLSGLGGSSALAGFVQMAGPSTSSGTADRRDG